MGLRRKSFAKRVVNDWNKLPQEVSEVGPVREFKGTLDKAWLAELGDDRVEKVVERKTQ